MMLITADWHLRGERPRCRTDADWMESQRESVREIVDLANEHKAELVIVGDVFHHARVSTETLELAVSELKRCEFPVAILAGNHDLPYHSWDLRQQSSIGVLLHYFEDLSTVDGIDAAPFGLDDPKGHPVAFTHQLVFPDDAARPFPDVGIIAEDLAEQFPRAQWIFTGDYHHAFIRRISTGALVANPGCINIQAADMADYQPVVYLVDAAHGSGESRITEIPLTKHGREFVTQEHLVAAAERDERLESFLELVRDRGGVSLNFRETLEARAALPEVPDAVRGIVVEVIHDLQEEK